MENKKKSFPEDKAGKRSGSSRSDDFTSPDNDADKTGSDNNADETVKRNRTEKSKLEIDPDSTGIDTKADKTKKEGSPAQKGKKDK